MHISPLKTYLSGNCLTTRALREAKCAINANHWRREINWTNTHGRTHSEPKPKYIFVGKLMSKSGLAQASSANDKSFTSDTTEMNSLRTTELEGIWCDVIYILSALNRHLLAYIRLKGMKKDNADPGFKFCGISVEMRVRLINCGRRHRVSA